MIKNGTGTVIVSFISFFAGDIVTGRNSTFFKKLCFASPESFRFERRNLMRPLVQLLIISILVLVVPTVMYAQAGAALTGVVTDPSGAVLPGVMVEARSPVLIEQVRSAITDETGRYRIVDLRPGTYSVTFALPGFASILREGIE